MNGLICTDITPKFTTMITETIAHLFERDLQKLKVEMSSYNGDTRCWEVAPGISNSAGNLCLHLAGNLQHFIGAVLGKSGYVRNRPQEFSQKNIPLAEMLATLDHTLKMITDTLLTLTPDDMEKAFPERINDYPFTIESFLLHLYGHLNYHLGQINYHRRILESQSK